MEFTNDFLDVNALFENGHILPPKRNHHRLRLADRLLSRPESEATWTRVHLVAQEPISHLKHRSHYRCPGLYPEFRDLSGASRWPTILDYGELGPFIVR
jgi:hypothetical protein